MTEATKGLWCLFFGYYKRSTRVWAEAIKPGSILGDGLWHKPVCSLETDWSGNRPSIGPIGLASLSDRSAQLSHVDRRLIRLQNATSANGSIE
ncbi:hypothetical protein PIB30_063939 [Stylosanthes scabra]|uniref:Uncharacterized protein n=1 Tax=Stylosanthes scabra TaxID=79078 RepID=A0ABU6RLY0_9FABA|nr:hypothetical protein [Stylosanthes scabra]